MRGHCCACSPTRWHFAAMALLCLQHTLSMTAVTPDYCSARLTLRLHAQSVVVVDWVFVARFACFTLSLCKLVSGGDAPCGAKMVTSTHPPNTHHQTLVGLAIRCTHKRANTRLLLKPHSSSFARNWLQPFPPLRLSFFLAAALARSHSMSTP